MNTTVTTMFGCTYPIFGLSHDPGVVAAISEAGGVGIWAAARLLPEEITDRGRELRERLGQRPFGINVMLPRGVPESSDRAAVEAQLPAEHRAFVDSLYDKYQVPRDRERGERDRIVRSEELFSAQVDAALGTGARLFAMAVGTRDGIAERARAQGMSIVALVGAPRHVHHAREIGADVIVAQGYDAGGHTGSIGTFSLVPRIVELAGETPVLAAGGVGTGAHVTSALALGAAGVWTGTLWLGTDEHGMPEVLLRKVIESGCEDTVVTRGSSGKPMRQIRTAWSDEWAAPAAPAALPMPWQDLLVGSLEGSVTRHEIAPLMYTPAGQSVEWIRGRTTVADTMNRLVMEMETARANLASSRTGGGNPVTGA
ncbi:NAD(P)H-dependent flavin oxidoreductase YrpB (nitropropane dioxygenase family) [Rhodococcus wratislaviensis]|uniref:2-nitropropane dioxygenase n=1 Tax=Rhodococcus wratislaviensis TaxID=44752 RepID=A0AB38F8E6_RHOWR|nr:nitronate monooxygenase [Rhodococcus wratislaviensis]REE73100.1 NAD(P)H-dependent flavin oxidoreductase YrpB (nitropropane dioxygenase family) [Rhodococcus wratislaviensis]SPZ37890.1 2-nitropropane dioxygenase [Rhodococcus wratislaviensis]